MKLRSSEIFDNFAKIAQDNGLISKEAAEETNPRYDSKTLSDIEVLYGVKPNGKDEKDIIDQAHPESVIIAPAYDRLNGLVENVKERHNIMVGIANKPPQAKLIGRKYAEEELLNELVRLGTLLDSKNQEDLMKLADGCAEKLTKTAVFGKDVLQLAPLAALPFFAGSWPAWAIAGTYIGVTALINNFGEKIAQGVFGDAERAKARLKSIINEWRPVDEDRGHLTQYITDMIVNIDDMLAAWKAGKDATVSSISDENINKEAGKMSQYKLKAKSLIRKINDCKQRLEHELDSEKSYDSDLWALVKNVGKYLRPDAITSAIRALDTLSSSLSESLTKMNKVVSQKIEEHKAKEGEEGEDEVVPSPQPKSKTDSSADESFFGSILGIKRPNK